MAFKNLIILGVLLICSPIMQSEHLVTTGIQEGSKFWNPSPPENNKTLRVLYFQLAHNLMVVKAYLRTKF